MNDGTLIFVGIIAIMYGMWIGITIEKEGIATSCHEEQRFDIDGTEYRCYRTR